MGSLTPAIRSWLILALVPGLAARRIVELTEHFGGAEATVGAGTAALNGAGLSQAQVTAIQQPDEERLEAARAWLGENDNHLVTLEDERYPPLLKRIADPPPLLWIRGDTDALWQPQLAVVGSRNPSAGGRDNAREFCAHLARSGLVITSGLAAGIDGEAHAAALEAGGTTIAVTGTGLDRVYPARHRALAHRIVARGALVSEFPLGAEARRDHFPRRNRLISGLSLGVLVVEAAQRSGSLITAHHAVDQGREVFAIPGSIHNPLAKGCHRLIREGAKLVETANDILEELAPMARELGAEIEGHLSESTGANGDPAVGQSSGERKAVLEAVGWDPTSVDEVVERTGLTAEAVSSMLLMLELDGAVASVGGGRYSRVRR